MADEADTKVSYPYMTAGQWFGVRAKLRQSLPSSVDVDWMMAALGTSEKGARNVLPQLKAVGIIGNDGKPTELVHDLRDDNSYHEACIAILDKLYPPALRSAWDNPDEDSDKVAAWFMRNAGTGEATAKMQAKLYLLLLKGELPSQEETAKKAARKATPTTATAKKTAKKAASATVDEQDNEETKQQKTPPPPPPPPPHNGVGPNLHIDMQIHISADASDTQIDTIFKSMAKHLYGRE
jgi:hypothetical protein